MAARAPFPAKVLFASSLGKKQGILTGVLIYLPTLQINSKNDLKNIPSLTLQCMCSCLSRLSLAMRELLEKE